ncbi:MAG: PAS domain-containing hybrid sensor histidine kinase/response regulator [Symbiobacteriia bacterium]
MSLHNEDEASRSRLEWLHSTLTSISDGVITSDTEGRVTFLNPVAAFLTGWTLTEAAGQALNSVFCIIDEESRLPVRSPAALTLSEGKIVEPSHCLLIHKSGTERPINDSAAPIRSDDGRIAGAVFVFRDATEQRRQERQLQEALIYAESVIATLRHPFTVLDQDLRILSANDAFYRTFHVSKAETEDCLIYSLGNGQWNIPRLRKLLDEVLADGHEFQDFEVERVFPNIGNRIMMLNARRVDSREGELNLILLAIEDVTNSRQSAAALENSEKRYRRLFETAQDAILILDGRSGLIIDANPFIQRLLGYSHSEFTGRHLWEIGMFEDKSAIQAAFEQLLGKGYIRYENLPLRAKSGQRVEVEFVSNRYEVDQQPIIQCNIRDISERVHLLRQTEEQAAQLRDLDKRKDEFLAMLSHELRSPLAPISNSVQLLGLEKGSESPTQREARTIIERQVGHLKHLVDDLLEVARIASGKIQLRRDWVNVQNVVAGAMETVRPLIQQRKHKLTEWVPPQPVWLYADAARLEQVLVNLLTNATKFNDENGHVWLSVQIEGDDCVFRVRDSGHGIAPDLLPLIFNLFTQGERSLDRSQGGLGIGLSLVQRLVELHGGTVEALSVLGTGSEFVVRLPVAPPPDARQPPLQATEAPMASRSLRVLVVDDSADTTDSLAKLLHEVGHDVRAAYDGLSALAVAIDFQPEVVLLDIGLPGLDGYTVAERFRQHPMLRHTVLVAMTGYGQESDRLRSHQAGFNHHLVKPTDFSDVQRILASVSGKAT